MKLLEECNTSFLFSSTKIFVNGSWVGVITNPQEILRLIKRHKRHGLVPIYNSVSWNIKKNEIVVFTDSGRLCRPIFYIDNNKPSFKKKEILEKLKSNTFSWNNLICGFSKKKDDNYDVNTCKYYKLNELYDTDDFEKVENTEAIIDYIDTTEEESALISSDYTLQENIPFTHVEIHPSLLLGVMGNQIVFPENNQLPRDLFSCGQSKQAVSLYSSNFFARIDKMGVVLNAGQIPLIKSRYLQYINNEEHPYGENVIVAIMVYGGYNVEDSILFNEGSVSRGMFRTTYYNMYESREESSKIGENDIDSHFQNIEDANISRLKHGYDYSVLDKYGLIKENTEMDDKKVIIGKIQTNLVEPDMSIDASVYPKKGQLGFVDKTFMTEDEEGFRLAKVRIREERVPVIGDKFCSRCGQKGTIGLVIPEKDMPFTEDGMKPDLIINPHALPSRMTIGQLVETLMGKACITAGGYGDCTAFVNKGSKHELFGKILNQNGYNSTGNQLLYNGMTGEQIQANIFIGPTYYMRLKHMVKDKINYRARGPIEMLTHQTVGGRAKDGGLRIGEMERDGIIAHGAAGFLQESMLTRGDEYYMAVCNNSGTIAIYNNTQNLFLSPMADGPIKFQETIDKTLNIENITKYGRNFSILKIPYTFKLLIQELQTMNIQMRLITEDNIDQVTNMAYSNNIIKLKNKVLSDSDTSQNEYINSTLNKEVSERSIRRIDNILNKALDDNVELDHNIDSMNEPSEFPKEEVDSMNLEPEEFGWSYYSYDDERGEAYKSIILDKNGTATEVWFVGEHDNDLPNRFPNEWNSAVLEYNDGIAIPPNIMIDELNNNQVPNNWSICLDIIKRENKGKPEEQISPQYIPGSPAYNPNDSPPYNPNDSPLSPHSPPYPPGSPVSVIQQLSPSVSPPYAPVSPPYAPVSPVYVQGSPAYVPDTPPYAPVSPPYAPVSPVYVPGSPAYVPVSPAYVPVSPAYVPGSPANVPGSAPYNPHGSMSSTENTPMAEGNDEKQPDEVVKRKDGIELIIDTSTNNTKSSDDNPDESQERKSININ